MNYDNRFLRTFIKLFTDPKDVIGGYIDGTRKKYVNVISYFAIAVTLSGIQIYIISKFFPETYNISSIIGSGKGADISISNFEFISEYQSIVMMLFVPFYAFLSRLVFLKNKKFNFSEHLVIFMYVSAHLSILSTIITIFTSFFGISIGTVSAIIMPVQVIYSAFCLKQLYTLSLKSILLKTLLFLFILIFVFILFSIVYTTVLIFIYGSFEEYQNSLKTVSYIVSSAINWTS